MSSWSNLLWVIIPYSSRQRRTSGFFNNGPGIELGANDWSSDEHDVMLESAQPVEKWRRGGDCEFEINLRMIQSE